MDVVPQQNADSKRTSSTRQQGFLGLYLFGFCYLVEVFSPSFSKLVFFLVFKLSSCNSFNLLEI